MCLHNLYYLSLTSCQHVCAWKQLKAQLKAICTGAGLISGLNFYFIFLMRRLSEMFALKTACQLSNYIFRYLKPKRLFSKKMGSVATVATVEYRMVFLSKYGVMYVFMGFTTLNFSDFHQYLSHLGLVMSFEARPWAYMTRQQIRCLKFQPIHCPGLSSQVLFH